MAIPAASISISAPASANRLLVVSEALLCESLSMVNSSLYRDQVVRLGLPAILPIQEPKERHDAARARPDDRDGAPDQFEAELPEHIPRQKSGGSAQNHAADPDHDELEATH